MKTLNKHPRLFKKIANTLKKLIQKQIKLVRSKMINVKNNGGNKNNSKTSSNNKIIHNNNNRNKPIANGNNEQTDFSRIISISSFRKIPYDNFILRLIPYDNETYINMLKNNYSPKVLITVSDYKSIHFILKILSDKWKNIIKINPKMTLYLIPISEFWIPHELIYFSLNDNKRAYDIGDIYTAYGSPKTNELIMNYQWTDEIKKFPIENDKDKESNKDNNSIEKNNLIQNNNFQNKKINKNNNNENIKKNIFDEENNMKIKDNIEDNVKEEDESSNNNLSEDYNNTDDSCPLLESDLNMFDPLEFLGIDVEKKNNVELKSNSSRVRTPSVSKKFIGRKKRKLAFVNNVEINSQIINNPFNNNNNNINGNNNKSKNETNQTNKSNKSNSHFRTGYNEIFSQNLQNESILTYTSNNDLNNNLNNNKNLSQISSHININNKNSKKPKKKIPFVNNVSKNEYKKLERINKEKQNDEINIQREKEEFKLNGTPIKNEFSKLNPFISKDPSPIKRIFTNNNNNNSLFNFQRSIFQPSYGVSQLLNQDNSLNMNTRLNIDNDYFNSNNDFRIFETNLLKSDYGNSNIYRNEFSRFSNNHFYNNPNYSQITDSENNKFKDKNNNDENLILGKKNKRKEKKKDKKITLEEIEENEKKQKIKKKKNNKNENKNNDNNNKIINNNNNVDINFNNHNKIFNSYPPHFYPQIPKNIDIPYPSQFIEK